MADTRIKPNHRTNQEVESKADLLLMFSRIQQELAEAKSRPKLTESYRKAAYLMALTHSPAWDNKFGPELADMRKIAILEFATLARKANSIANQIGTVADYDDQWGNAR